MFTVRKNVFETNSSSTHSLCICTQKEFDMWKNKEAIYDGYNEKIISAADYLKLEDFKKEDCIPYDRYLDDRYFGGYMKHFEREFTTPSGDKMIAFGAYGYDG